MIRKWLQSLFGWPCDHEWELLREGQWVNTDSKKYGLLWLYRCVKCCKTKKIKT